MPPVFLFNSRAMPALPPRKSILVACLAIVYVVWGSTYLAIHIAIAGVPPLLLAASRWAWPAWAC